MPFMLKGPQKRTQSDTGGAMGVGVVVAAVAAVAAVAPLLLLLLVVFLFAWGNGS